jgi:hypothetical protein
VGKVYALPAGSQYDDYFENPNGDRFGIDSTVASVRDLIATKRDTERTVYVWGTLLRDVPDVNGVQIAVTRIEESTTIDVDWVGTIVAFAAGAQYDDYFERDNGERYGIASSDDAIADAIEQYRSTGSKVRVVGTMTTNAPDAYNSQIAVTTIEVSPQPGPATATPTPTATPDGECAIPTEPIIPTEAVPLPAAFPPKPLYMASPEYGMTINVWGMGECITERDLELVTDAGFTWVRQMFRWREIEVAKGVFEWNEADRIVAAAAEYKLDLAIAVAYQPAWAGGGYPLNGPPDNMADFAEFMGALAQRYRGLVRAYEIWPGPNVSENWGGGNPQPHRYAEMLIDGYWYVKDQDPFAMIITGGLVQTADHDAASIPPWDFFTTLYEHTGAPTASDVWGVQAYGFKAAPEQSPQELAHPDWNNSYPATAERNQTWGFRSIEVLHDYTVPPDKPIMKQWAITEMGWTTDPNERSWVHWAATTEEVKADYLRRAYRWAKEQWSDWIGVVFVPLTDARLTTADEGYWWAVVDPDGDPRPAYDALKAMNK